ncbi:unnamed protein product [Cylicostephanus goldi]|uniref:Uncharacterized protein n=1 Tax=Cylicostephanus goldi TaxID=71465 RepID=A0A3P7MWZ1_CYLGO|nr:unnamed protein product [Cylicostephanus goldi]
MDLDTDDRQPEPQDKDKEKEKEEVQPMTIDSAVKGYLCDVYIISIMCNDQDRSEDVRNYSHETPIMPTLDKDGREPSTSEAYAGAFYG